MVEAKPDTDDRRRSRKHINQLFNTFESGLTDLGIHDAAQRLESERSIHELRKGRDRRDQDDVSVLTLKETDGVLRWETGSGFQPPERTLRRGGRRRRRSDTPFSGQIIRQFKFENLEPNQIDKQLRKLDHTLNDHQGFWLLNKGTDNNWQRTEQLDEPVTRGKVLLIIHGTFSNIDNNLNALNETSFGRTFLNDAKQRYKQLIAFGHPTVGVSPFTNAVKLASFFRRSDASVDVICHSRGGLVARWWKEVIESQARRKVRVTFLGSTLGGTSLASPHQLKSALNLLVNVSRAVTAGSQVGAALFPPASGFFAASIGLSRIFANVVSGFSKTPIIDAGVALVPGLNGQSRQGGNTELLALRDNFAGLNAAERKDLLNSYQFIGSNFEPDTGVAWWKFWKYFNKHRIADFAADRIFSDSNDLVVDTASMNELCDLQTMTEAQLRQLGNRSFLFPTSANIHHLNYFSHSTTIRKFRSMFF